MASKMKLFDSDDEDSDPEDCKLTINKDYAEKYTAWKEKEELQKLKEKYGDLSDDDSTSEDEEQMNWNAEFDKEWLRVYSAVKFKDKDIYDKDIQFVRDEVEAEKKQEDEGSDSDSSESGQSERETTSKKKKEKKKQKDDRPLTIREHERRIMTDRQGVLSESEDDEDMMAQAHAPGYHEEQEAIRKSFTKVVADMSSGDEDEDILTHRVKSEKEREKEEEEYLQFLKGEKEAEEMTSQDKQIAGELAPLRTLFSQSEGDTEASKVVWDTLICRGALKENKDDADEELSEDESELIRMEEDEEEFEHTYNFRFEEPDKNFIKQYKRNPEDSVRQTVNKRAEKRKEVQQRKKTVMEERREEIRRLKKLKQKELEGRLQLLMKECPSGVDFTAGELKGDFDPKLYDKMMQEKFANIDDEDDDGDEEKPDMADLEDVLSIDSHEDIFEEADNSQREEMDNGDEDDDDEEDDGDNDMTSRNDGQQAKESKFSVDAEFDLSLLPGTSRMSRKARRRRKSKFQQALDAEKPLFSQVQGKYGDRETAWEDYVQEYYKLDYREHGFRYRKVVPNDYGMHPGEILWLPARELNSWVSMKKVVEQKPESEELYEKRQYQSSKMQRKILNVMPSLKKIEDEESKYEDIRPSILRQQRMAQIAAEEDDSDMSEAERHETDEEDLGTRLQTDSQPSPKKKKKRLADLGESAEQDAPPRKKKKKLKAGGSQSLNNGDVTNVTNQTEDQGEGRKKKRKKKKALGTDKGIEGSSLQSEEKKKKVPLENSGAEVPKKKKKKKNKTETVSDASGEQVPSKKGKKMKKRMLDGEEQPQTSKQNDKKKFKGKKKQKKGDGTPKVKGYIPVDKIQESRLAAFHIDPRKFKYTKDRLVPLQPDQD